MSELNHKSAHIFTICGIFKLPEFKLYDVEEMIRFLGRKYANLHYKWFSTETSRNFIFISKEKILFSKFEIPSSDEYKKGLFVEGLLYDVDNKKFVAPAINSINSKMRWLTYFLYDNEIPHVYQIKSGNCDEDVSKYAILYWNKQKNKFSKIVCRNLPTFVSYFGEVTSENISICQKLFHKRVIFYKKDKKANKTSNQVDVEPTEENHIIILNDSLEISFSDNHITLESIVFHVNQYESTKNRFKTLQEYHLISPLIIEKGTSFGSVASIVEANENHIFHIFNNDSLIAQTPKGEFGEYVIVFLNFKDSINYSLSFFRYQKVKKFKLPKNVSRRRRTNPKNCEYFLETISRKNDFENMIHYINLVTHDVVKT